MTITPVAVPQTVTVHGSTVTAEPVTQNTQVSSMHRLCECGQQPARCMQEACATRRHATDRRSPLLT
jgi:hypothetical protein